jgi:hypothetical protein
MKTIINLKHSKTNKGIVSSLDLINQDNSFIKTLSTIEYVKEEAESAIHYLMLQKQEIDKLYPEYTKEDEETLALAKEMISKIESIGLEKYTQDKQDASMKSFEEMMKPKKDKKETFEEAN